MSKNSTMQLPTKVSERVSGVVIDDPAIKSLLRKLDDIRTSTSDDDPFEKLKEKQREIAEELCENLEHISGIPGLSDLTDRLYEAMSLYDETDGMDNNLPQLLTAVADLLEDHVQEVSDLAAYTREIDEDDVIMLLAGSSAEIRASLFLEKPMTEAALKHLVRSAVETVRGFVVTDMAIEIRVYGGYEGQGRIGESGLLYPYIESYDICYIVSSIVTVNTDVPEHGVVDLITECLGEADLASIGVEVRRASTALLGVGIRPEQLFSADKAVIESQKAYSIEEKNIYDIKIRLWVTTEYTFNTFSTGDIRENVEYALGLLNAELVSPIKQYDVVSTWRDDDDFCGWEEDRVEITDDIADCYVLINGKEKYYEMTFGFTTKKPQEIEELHYMFENALDLGGDDNVRGLEIEVNGIPYFPDSYNLPVWGILDYFGDTIFPMLEEKGLPQGLCSILVFDYGEYVAYHILHTEAYKNGLFVTETDVMIWLEAALKAGIKGSYKDDLEKAKENGHMSRLEVLYAF